MPTSPFPPCSGSSVQPARPEVEPPFPIARSPGEAAQRRALPPPFPTPAAAQARVRGQVEPPFPTGAVQPSVEVMSAAAAPSGKARGRKRKGSEDQKKGGGDDQKKGGGDDQKKGGGDDPKGNRRSKRIKVLVPLQVTAFQVTWGPHANNAAAVAQFRLDVVVTFNRAPTQGELGRMTYNQYVYDRARIGAGTGQGHVVNRNWVNDAYTMDDGNVDDTTISWVDQPGYSVALGLDATSDLHYTFGARWRLRLDDVDLVDTTALYGTIVGTHARACTPNAAAAATWDGAAWNNVGGLLQALPALPANY